MIDKISIITNIKTNTLKRIRSLNNNFNLRFNIPKLKTLKQDIFELSSSDGFPEVLMYNPSIVESRIDTGIKDSRFSYFCTAYRAYNHEGYDDKFPSNYVCIDSNGERRLKPHIYLGLVEIKPEYARQGIFTNAMKRLSKFAKNEDGCEGRIILDAHKIDGVFVTQIPSPSLAHWKCGFRFANNENNKIMEKVLNGELPLEDAPEGAMYYAKI